MWLTRHIKFCTCNNSTAKYLLACVGACSCNRTSFIDRPACYTSLFEICHSFCYTYFSKNESIQWNKWLLSPPLFLRRDLFFIFNWNINRGVCYFEFISRGEGGGGEELQQGLIYNLGWYSKGGPIISL